MKATTAARLGGEEKGATFTDKETGRVSRIFPIWGYGPPSNPLTSPAEAYRVQISIGDEGEIQEAEIPNHDISKVTQEYPALWKPNITLPCDIYYFALEHSLQPSQFLLRINHGCLAVRVRHGSTVVNAESHYGVIEATWQQDLSRTQVTTIQIIAPKGHGVYEETFGVITMHFTDDKEIERPYRMMPVIATSDEFPINMYRI